MAIKECKNLKELQEYTAEGYSVIDCYGTFCAACVMLEPVYEEIAGDMAGIRFAKVNVSECADVAEHYRIEAMPTVVFQYNGEEVHRMLGSVGREEFLSEIAVMLYQKPEA